MNKLFNILSAVMLIGMAVVMTATIKTVSGIGTASSYNSATFTYSQTDTVKWAREKGVKELTFVAKYSDTVNVVTARVLRVVNGKPISQGTALLGDTLPNLTALIDSTPANATAGIVRADRIVLTGETYLATPAYDDTVRGFRPLADEYWVIIQYDSLPTGTFASSTVRYEFIKEY